jgi:two-component system, OmpR family, alkaline phosphatase synthesis response regulator PhoP
MEVLNKKILVVDDEEDLCEIIRVNLSNSGYCVEIAPTAEEAIKRQLNTYDLILLNILMDKISGFLFALKLRNEMEISTPFIILSSRNTEDDILASFRLGADDYITKPFSINVLKARIGSIIRRYKERVLKESNVTSFGNLVFDKLHGRIIINDECTNLTKKEYGILKLVFDNPGTIFSREEILKKVWLEDKKVRKNTVDVSISRLRVKLGEYGILLCNKPGFGFYFDCHLSTT